MWRRKRKVWFHYQPFILATDSHIAIFLQAYLRHVRIEKLYSWQMEVIDLQKNKIISSPLKVHQAMKENSNEPFVFVVGKN